MKESTPLFSIITVTYNAAATLPTTLRSVDEQTCTDYEHLIIDGASKDTTLSTIGESSNPRRSVYSEPDKGLYDAMNKGIRRARGKYLIFLNAGDAFAQASTLERYAGAAVHDFDIIYADTQLVDADGKVLGPRHLSVPRSLTVKSFAHGMLVCHQAFCVKRLIAPLYDLNYRFSADYDWCIRCMQQTDPQRCQDLNTIAIDYLSEGMTTAHHKASLKERYRIMCHYYGTLPTIARHIGFAMRAAGRRLLRR